jgi:hypothetical protein
MMLVGSSHRAQVFALRELRRIERDAQTRADEARAVLEAERREAVAETRHDALMHLIGSRP